MKDTELGLRNDIGKGVGITTTIQSRSVPDFSDSRAAQSEKSGKSGSGRPSRYPENEWPLRSPDREDWPLPSPNAAEWGVRKTMEVTTSQEVKPWMAGRPGLSKV